MKHCKQKKQNLYNSSAEFPKIFIILRTAEMSGLSYFAIQFQSWYFKTQSKSNRSPKNLKILKFQSE